MAVEMKPEWPELKPAWVVKCETCGAIADPDTRKITHRIVDDHPTEEELEEWVLDIEEPRATDGCSPVEPDGSCEHGHLSWMRALGLV
jgi:hypothetical protein